MKNLTVGIIAHVDAGKTTLSQAVLYKSGQIRSLGTVDGKDTVLDTHTLEKQRGITIFASRGVFEWGNSRVTLIDTPGHVDFSSETERALSVLDVAVLVISGLDGVQSHTKTLWRLLEHYNIPVFIFVTKMDFNRLTEDEIMQSLCSELSDNCVSLASKQGDLNEKIAMCHEDLLESYLEGKEITNEDITLLVATRKMFPVFFGSGLKMQGIEALLDALDNLTMQKNYPDVFGARVYKIEYDGETRVTHIKVTGGSVKVKEQIGDEKINQIRVYSGKGYVCADEATAGQVCALTGLNKTESGQGLGYEKNSEEPCLEPVMNYRILLPDDVDPEVLMPKLRKIEEEDSLLNFTFNQSLKEIYVSLMGVVQAEILKALVKDRFDVSVEFDKGRVLYKETIEAPVEGVGHFEPLRHYAEAHILIEPLPRGSGIKFGNRCSEEMLSRNWQRLILTHLEEKQHLGVLTGSPLTDVKLTLVSGRAHLKHTEGGDFRQAVYRAVRQGLMNAKSVLLEPYFSFVLEIPFECLGRAISDIKARYGTFDAPEQSNSIAVIRGSGPVICFADYAPIVSSYSGGTGKFICRPGGYDICHNADEVIAQAEYNPQADLENTPDSVFCAHGAGFNVPWYDVKNYMHIAFMQDETKMPVLNKRNFHIDDKELQAILEKEFGPVKYNLFRASSGTGSKEGKDDDPVELTERKRHLIIDGYNLIFASEGLNKLAEHNLDAAREKLIDILSNYAAFTGQETVLVFDAYKVPGNRGEKYDVNGIHIAFTKERELADVYIERLISKIGKNERVRVVSSDNLIQLTAVKCGVLRVSAREFLEEISEQEEKITELLNRADG